MGSYSSENPFWKGLAYLFKHVMWYCISEANGFGIDCIGICKCTFTRSYSKYITFS